MLDPQEKDEESLLVEIQKEILRNAIYYIDSRYDEIKKRNTLKREVENLRMRTQVKKVEGTVDLGVLLERVCESSNGIHAEKTLPDVNLSKSEENVLYSVDFTNTEIEKVNKDRIEILEKIKRSMSK